jgi:hypothetical protein
LSAPSLRDAARGSTSTWPGDPVLNAEDCYERPKIGGSKSGKMMEHESPSIYIYGIDGSCRFLTQGPGVSNNIDGQYWWEGLITCINAHF